MSELCIICARENCTGQHKCENCGKNAESPLMVGDKFYCDKFCLYSKSPSHPLLAGVPADQFKSFEKRADIVGRMRALKREADEAGVAWIS